jgi:4'-phosphopantetheinyl transferase
VVSHVRVWFRETESLDEAAVARAVSLLSAEERAQHARFHFARDARDYAAAHALLRTVLSKDTSRPPECWRFDKTSHGKPFLIGEEELTPSFSLSHAHGMVACAVAHGVDIGVDVECVDREVDFLEIAARFFSPAEAQRLAHLDLDARRQRFFDLWTLKEALVKAMGLGLSVPLASIAFVIDGAGGVTLDAPPEIVAGGWEFGLFAPGPKHRLAVAVSRSPWPVQLSLQSVGREV